MTPEEFRAARAALGLSVERLAAALQVTPRTIRRWQNGARRVPGPAAVAIERMLEGRTNGPRTVGQRTKCQD